MWSEHGRECFFMSVKLIFDKVYFCRKVKHIPFYNTTKVLETVRMETFERYQHFIVVDNKNRIPAIC